MKKIHNTQKISITLTDTEVAQLRKVIKSGTQNARTITRARILLLSHSGKTNTEIIDALGCAPRNVTDVRRRYTERGSIDAVLRDAPRPGQPKKVTLEHEAFVIATACTNAPEGHDHWTLDALKEKLLQTHYDLKSISPERIRQMLVQAKLKPWREKNVVHPETHSGVSGTHG